MAPVIMWITRPRKAMPPVMTKLSPFSIAAIIDSIIAVGSAKRVAMWCSGVKKPVSLR